MTEAGQQRRAPMVAGEGSYDCIVIGAGAFGAWTAMALLDAGNSVLLVDAWGPANSQASSGGESRMIRAAYGPDILYSRMAVRSLPEWKALSNHAPRPIFHDTGVLFFFRDSDPFAEQTLEIHRRLGLRTELLDQKDLSRRFPQFAWHDVAMGLFEPGFGPLMARRAVETLVARFVAESGEYRQAAIAMPHAKEQLGKIETETGEKIVAGVYIFACGSWLPKLFPSLLADRIFPTQQDVFFFAPPSDDRFSARHMPGWADFNGGDIYYGFPDLENRGLKIAHDKHGPPIDPDMGDRIHSDSELAIVREYLASRFPELAETPLVETRTCHYENSSSGDFLIDRHPHWQNVILVGAGSGHGFKHGPAVGEYAANLVMGKHKNIEPRFALGSKAKDRARKVH